MPARPCRITTTATRLHQHGHVWEKERASLLEALRGSCSQEPMSPIVNTLPIGPPIVSPAFELSESSSDTPISANSTLACSGRQLFSPRALPTCETDGTTQPPDEVIKECQ